MRTQCGLHVAFDVDQGLLCRGQIDFFFSHSGADIARNIEIEVVLFNLCHVDAARVEWFFRPMLVCVDNLCDVCWFEHVLAFAFFEMLCSIDKEHIVRLFAFFEDEDTDRDAGGVEKIGRQADDGVDMAVLEEFGADAFNTQTNAEDQESQAKYLVGNWKEIYANAARKGKSGNSIGGFTFQFSDGWWKYGQTLMFMISTPRGRMAAIKMTMSPARTT